MEKKLKIVAVAYTSYVDVDTRNIKQGGIYFFYIMHAAVNNILIYDNTSKHLT